MTMIRRTYPLELAGVLGPRQVRVRASTANIGRDGMIVHPAGIDLTSYRKNPVMLWQHDPSAPVARASSLGMEGPDLCADVEFAPEGISAKADEICGLVKAGIINAVSIGFDPQETEPLNPQKPRGGQRVLRSELMEISFVSVPADREAVVLQRKKVLAAIVTPEEEERALELEETRASDKPEGDYGDEKYADPGYQEDKKPRYPLTKEGELDEERIKAAWNYIHQEKNASEYSAGQVAKIKNKIIAAWKEKIDKDGPPSARDDGESGGRAARDASWRSERAAARAPMTIRGMYGVAQLAYLVDSLCDAKCSAEIESALEGDASQVPAMLAKALQDAGAALIAMAEEEVAELIGDEEVDTGSELGLDEPDVVLVMEAKTPAQRKFRIGYLRTKAAMTGRAGAKHSAATMGLYREAMDHHDEGMELARCAMRSFTRAAQTIGGLMDSDTATSQPASQDTDDLKDGARDADADYRRRQADLLALRAA